MKFLTLSSIQLSLVSFSVLFGILPSQAQTAIDTEPNSTFETRQFLPGNTNLVNGSLSPAGDVDFLSFENLDSQFFIAEITSGEFDSVLGLFDDDGNLVVTDDDGGNGLLSRLVAPVSDSNTVNLGVTGFADFDFTGAHNEFGDYTLDFRPLLPSTVSYAVEEVPFAFEDISETGTRVLGGADDGTFSTDLGFTFNFYGEDYTNISWSSNGLMTFGGGNSDFFNVDFTTTSTFQDLPSIAPLWDDWQFFSPGTDASYFTTLGTPGNQRFITQWNLADGFSDSPSSVTFQTTLFEGSNEILFSYLDVDSNDFRAFGGSATVGVRNSFGDITGDRTQFSFDVPSLRNNQSLLFSPVVPEPEPSIISSFLALGILGAGSVFKRKLKI